MTAEPIADWVAEVDRARAAGEIPSILPTTWFESLLDSLSAATDEHAALPKEVWVSLLTEGSLAVDPRTARGWRHAAADAQDAPQDLVVFDIGFGRDILRAVLAVRRVLAESMDDTEDPAFREFIAGSGKP